MMQTIKERIDADFISAYKNKDTERKNFLGLLKGEIQNNVGRGLPANDENVIKVLKSVEKGLVQLMEATKVEDSVELDLVRSYLPKMMDDEAITDIVEGLRDDGLGLPDVMKHFRENYAGRVDNKRVVEIAKSVLS